MKIHIVASGAVTGTKLFTEDGQNITDDVEAVRFSHKGGEAPRVEIDLAFPSLKVTADATLFYAPAGGERKAIKRIEFADGSVFEP